MTVTQQLSAESVPDHVPAELVKPWDYMDAPGADRDVHGANTVLFDGPCIFYSPNIRVASQFGGWQVARADLICEILRDTENFTSHHLTGYPQVIGEDWDLIPLEVEGEMHRKYRTLLNPMFNPAKAQGLEEKIRDTAVALAERTVAEGGGGIDFQAALGNPFPIGVFLHLMGWPIEKMPAFIEWSEMVLHGASLDEVREGSREIKQFLLGEAAKEPAGSDRDLFSAIRNASIDGRAITDDELLSIAFTVFLGGLDTVANALGFSFRYLADNPDQQNLLRTNPELIPNAVHELIRTFPPATTTRTAKRDVEFHGVQIKEGDVIRLLIPIAGRDTDSVGNPLEVDFRRKPNSQISFGTGPHMCIGMHLARVEIRIALEEWLPRLPEFQIDPGHPPVFQPDGVWGVNCLPLIWNGTT